VRERCVVLKIEGAELKFHQKYLLCCCVDSFLKIASSLRNNLE